MIEEHLTFGEIEDYAARRLAADRIPVFQEHLEVCPVCRGMARAAVIGAEHVSEQEAVEFVAGLLSEDRRSWVAEHRDTCPACAAMVEDLEEYRLGEKGRSVSRRAYWLMPVAAAVLVGVSVAAWLATRPGKPVPAPVVTASLRDPALTPGSGFPAGDSEIVATALRSGQMPAGPGPIEAEQRGMLRSEGPVSKTPELRVISPSGVRVVSDRPEFRWNALPGASSYEVTVFDTELNEVARSGPVQSERWTSSKGLPRGRVLVWQVAAVRHGERITAPAPPEGSPRFEVVPEELAGRIARAEAAQPRSHLLLAVLYAQAGLQPEAGAELDGLAAANPGSPVVDSLRASLHLNSPK